MSALIVGALDDRERRTVCDALRVAAAQYDSDANVCEREPAAGNARVVAQFRRQASDARALLRRMGGEP